MSQSKFTASERADKCVLSLEQAIYQTTKRERGLVGAICSIYGLNYNTVSAQINPNNDSHTLSPDIIEYVLTHAENKTLIMDAICCAHGNAGFSKPSMRWRTHILRQWLGGVISKPSMRWRTGALLTTAMI